MKAMFMKAMPIQDISKLAVGMKLEIISRRTSNKIEGVVSDVRGTRRNRFIDGKPVASTIMVKEVIISYEQGEEGIIDHGNFSRYKIRRIG